MLEILDQWTPSEETQQWAAGTGETSGGSRSGRTQSESAISTSGWAAIAMAVWKGYGTVERSHLANGVVGPESNWGHSGREWRPHEERETVPADTQHRRLSGSAG